MAPPQPTTSPPCGYFGRKPVVSNVGIYSLWGVRLVGPEGHVYAFETAAPPRLVKIDVEGLEGNVVAGMAGLLASVRPVVVFEAPDYGGGEHTGDVVAQFVEHGYRVWSLTPRGLRSFTAEHFSHNLLALRAGDHEQVRARLRAVCFPRSQNC